MVAVYQGEAAKLKGASLILKLPMSILTKRRLDMAW